MTLIEREDHSRILDIAIGMLILLLIEFFGIIVGCLYV